jgi:hypothetical protein
MACIWSPTIDCAEEQGSCTEEYDEEFGILSAQVVLRCLYINRHALASDICGNRRPYPKGSAGPTPVALRASIAGTDTAGFTDEQGIFPLHALVTIQYSSKLKDQYSESIEPTVEFQDLDYRNFKWSSGAKLCEDEHPAFLVRGMNLCRSEVDLTEVQVSIPELTTLAGHVNAAPYTSSLLGRSFAAETLLYHAPVINRKVNSLNIAKFDVSKKWSINYNGWNRYYRAKTNAYEVIVHGLTGVEFKCYPVSSMTAILPP